MVGQGIFGNYLSEHVLECLFKNEAVSGMGFWSGVGWCWKILGGEEVLGK